MTKPYKTLAKEALDPPPKQTHWKHEPRQSGACKWFLWVDGQCKAWVCTVQNTGTYIVDSWGVTPPPNGPYDTLEAAKMAAEMMYN